MRLPNPIPPEPIPEAALQLRAVTCRRGLRVVIRDLTAQVSFGGQAGGRVVLLRGANGSGKTTLLRCIAGLLPPAKGAVVWSGFGAEGAPPRIGWQSHVDALKPQLSPREDLALWAACCGHDPAPDAISAVLALVGLAERADLPNRFLSQGLRRRLALARLLVGRMPVWLLDEPSAGLDQDGRALLGQLLAMQVAGGGLVVAATHDALPLEQPPATIDLDQGPA